MVTTCKCAFSVAQNLTYPYAMLCCENASDMCKLCITGNTPTTHSVSEFARDGMVLPLIRSYAYKPRQFRNERL